MANTGDPVFDDQLNVIGYVVWSGMKTDPYLCGLWPSQSSLNEGKSRAPARGVGARRTPVQEQLTSQQKLS